MLFITLFLFTFRLRAIGRLYSVIVVLLRRISFLETRIKGSAYFPLPNSEGKQNTFTD